MALRSWWGSAVGRHMPSDFSLHSSGTKDKLICLTLRNHCCRTETVLHVVALWFVSSGVLDTALAVTHDQIFKSIRTNQPICCSASLCHIHPLLLHPQACLLFSLFLFFLFYGQKLKEHSTKKEKEIKPGVFMSSENLINQELALRLQSPISLFLETHLRQRSFFSLFVFVVVIFLISCG